jgi:RimJ/RimL family protein N-acetyltransferase
VSGLSLRPAEASDARTLWRWAGDPASAAGAAAPAGVPWEAHAEWLAERLADAGTLLFVAEVGRCPVGTVRFESTDAWRTARVSLGLAAQARGRGLGGHLVAAGLRALWAAHPAATVVADVPAGDEPSLRVFRKLGWLEEPAGKGATRFVGRPREAA